MQQTLPKQLSPLTPNHSTSSPITRSKELNVLMSLGLTSRQARVYIALLKIGKGKAKAIADCSLVNRQEIYRVLESLQQLGLVQKNISAPTTYKATPITDVINTLLEQKTTQLNAIRQKTKQLTKKLKNISQGSIAELDEKRCLGTVFEGERGEKYRRAISSASQNIDIITSWKRFKQLTTLLEAQLKNALQKGITLHIITEKPPNQPFPDWITNTQTQTINKKHQNLKLKTLPNSPTAAIAIFDHTTAAVAFHPNTSLTKGPDLWTTNSTLLALSQTYFNNAWTQTINSTS